MPIIIDNFSVNSNIPIDNRFVVGGIDSFYQDKDNIQFKYQGLRIWDIDDNVPYYWTGTEWLSENAIGVTVNNTTSANYLPLFSSETILGNSLLFQTVSTQNIGIGITNINLIDANKDLTNSTIPGSIGGLHTNGNIKTNENFIGKGNYITELNASNITSGLISISRISHLSANNTGLSTGKYVLTNFGIGSSVIWELANTLKVDESDKAVNVKVTNDTSIVDHFLTFVSNVGNAGIKINTTNLLFRPSNGQLFLSNGSATVPVYSFVNNKNSGIYFNQGISTSIANNEITSVKSFGLITNNRIYIPTSSNNTDVGYGIVWMLNNNATNDINTNDGFVYNTQRLNFYGLGSHIPTDSGVPTGRGTYIAGYFGVDIFSGSRLKVKIDEYNDVTITSRLNIYNSDILGSNIGNNLVLSTMRNVSQNNIIIKDYSVRSAPGSDWTTWKHHNGITIDGNYNSPNAAANGTLTFWERHPYLNEQYFGSANKKTLTINSDTNPFVKIDGNLLVGTITTSLYAIVDFTSTTKGFLPPRMTNVQRNLISTALESGGQSTIATGLTIYNTDKKSLDTYDGSLWSSNIKTKNIDITGWVKDRRQINLTHNLNNIISYDILVQCITSEHGYVAGDITKPSPSFPDEDVTIKYNGTSTKFDLLVGNNIRVRNISNSSDPNNAEPITPTRWLIRVVFYHYSTIN